MTASECARYAAADLRAFCARALERAGARPGDAAVVAEGLIAADLRGVHSRGALRIGVYVDRLRAGSINPCAELEIVRDHGAVIVADAQAGLGIAMTARAMDLAIARAQVHGIAAVGVRNGNHCGMLAYLAMRAPRAGAVGIAMSNADSQVEPWGARAKFLGTNPLAVAVPAGDEPPVVLDIRIGKSIQNQSRAGGATFYDMTLLALLSPGVTAHNGAYVASRAAIGEKPHGNLSAWRFLGNERSARSETTPRAADSGDVGDGVVGQDTLGWPGRIRGGRCKSAS